MCKIVGFLTNKLTLRGTEIAVYDYADFNERLLGNKSIIITRPYELVKTEYDTHLDAYTKFTDRFTIKYYTSQADLDEIVTQHNITHLYIIKYGLNDGMITTRCKTLVHCVFDTSQPHGDIYSPISQDINNRFKTTYPVLPHMIHNFDTDLDMREELGIPINAIVFGRYGGLETFDIPFVHEVIKSILNNRTDIYFIFMNTNEFYSHPRIIYLKGTTNMESKRKFINTSDALLHARKDGETFGLTCGEFAIQKKPVITWGGSTERNHLDILKDKAVIYNNQSELYYILNNFNDFNDSYNFNNFYNSNQNKYDVDDNGYGYLQFTPEKAMNIFNSLFLSL